MSQRFNANQVTTVNQDNRNMAAEGFPMGDELNDIWAAIDTGNIGITADANDVDSLAKGGGHFSRDVVTGDGSTLTFAWFAGRFHNGKANVTVSAGSLTLGASATNYVEVDRAGTVSVNQTGFTSGKLPLYTIITGSSSYTDNNVTISKPLLTLIGSAGVDGSMLSTAAATKEIWIDLGTLSATATDKTIVLPKIAGTITGITLVAEAAISQSDTDYWKFKAVNKGVSGGGTAVVVDDTVAANTTKTTGGSAITAFAKRALTLNGTPTNVAEDSIAFTVTKTGSPSNLVGLKLRVDVQFVG